MELLTPGYGLLFFMGLSLISVILLVIALIKLIKKEKIETTTKLFWALIILFVWLVGPILYLTMGEKKN